ncbi:MAG: thioredoxin domain-containing protein [Armatimonadetes bacterium]|nr:thioredoxin domain-containing protein [Armatimonadota bacterium]
MGNRLADASSPYLRQHKNNPVHWQPWDDAAFALARDQQKPIFLSVGYSSCHWCHVMEHESFENPEIAAILNDKFVSIKVDREERPDVDETYMAAVQMSSGHGGWPMTLFLTPEREPFFAGTYLPAEDRGQYAGFKTILTQISIAWNERRPELQEAANSFGRALEETMRQPAPEATGVLGWPLIDFAIEQMKNRFDVEHGGFGERPKFPPHQAIALLLYMAEHHERKDCLKLATRTLDGMMLGGMHDHVGGGFHRYSTDEEWLLPHFEKMLYDNALMLANYANASRLTANQEYRRVCDRLVAWLEREMMSSAGTFYSALDADSEGEEGKFYTWGRDDASVSEEFKQTFGLTKDGNFLDEATGVRTGHNIPHLTRPQGSQWDQELDSLREQRERRARPGLDDKILVAWNGLMISGLVAAGRSDLAGKCAATILSADRVPHQFAGGKPEGEPFLDLAYLVQGLLDLGVRTEAEKLFDKMIDTFHDGAQGGWFFSGDRHEHLFGASKAALDSATPSPSAVAIRCAVRLGRHEIAQIDLRAMLGWMERAPLASEAMLLTTAMLLETAAIQDAPERPTVTVRPSESKVVDGRAIWEIRIDLPSGSHINPAVPEDDYLTPTSISLAGLGDTDVRIPDGELTGPVAIPIIGTPPTGKEGEAKANVRFQVCTDNSCLAPQEHEVSLVWYREA